MSGGAPAIEIAGLNKWFARQQGWRSLLRPGAAKVVLDDINLTIPAGEIFGLLGPNGAGKTTLVKILSTLILPSSGRALVDGRDVTRQGREVRRRLGVVYGDERSFFWRLSALENLRFYAALYQIPAREAERRIRALLELVGLAHDADRRMHHYSTGMRQRVAIARGLLNDPTILLMDEPTRGLDPVAALELRTFLREQVLDGRRTVLTTTHIMAEAEELCHRLAFLNHGRIQLVGSIGQIRAAFQPMPTHVLVASDLPATALDDLRRLDGVHSVAGERLRDERWELTITLSPDAPAMPRVIRAIVDAGGLVWSSTPREISWESMFALATDGAAGASEPGGRTTPARASDDLAPIARAEVVS